MHEIQAVRKAAVNIATMYDPPRPGYRLANDVRGYGRATTCCQQLRLGAAGGAGSRAQDAAEDEAAEGSAEGAQGPCSPARRER